MRWRAFLLSFAIGMTLANPLNAQQVGEAPPKKEKGPWSGKVAIGFLATSGNTESSSLNSGFVVTYSIGKWAHSLQTSAIKATEEEQTTSEAYSVGWKSEYNLSQYNFLFGRVNWRKDRFSAYDQQLSESFGYGRRLIDTGSHFLNVEIGAGARQADRIDGTTEEEVILRSGLSYGWKLNDTAQFTQDFAVESGSDNTYSESVTAVKTTLLGSWSLVASYTVKNNSETPIGTENTDTFAALSVEYPF